MTTKLTIKSIAACAIYTVAAASLAQNSGHSDHSGHAGQAGQSHQAPITLPTPISPYSGEQNRAIKALSADDITGLTSGAGMAYAKAAELNNYPGPAHVLELATPLKLDASQRQASEALMVAHKNQARLLGNQLVEAERQLDLAFSTRQITPQLLDTLTARIGELQAALRAEHLQTHLKQTALLNSQQIASYQVLRGYRSADATQPILKAP